MYNFKENRMAGNTQSPTSKISIPLIFYHGARWILGVIFIYASYDKIIHPFDFATVVNNYQLLPGELVNFTALVLPWLELFMGICLLTGWLMPGTAIVSTGLLFIFTMIIYYNIHRGLDINCGCFSTSEDTMPANIFTITRDTVFLLLSFYLCWFSFIGSNRRRRTAF
ncbi:Methylamine utilisation protein MauE [Desulfocicer vacuolatum DSM 3385]|uniref:Methylamine utilisation protein MauE n=1 Tax=Desulfocicer vacuolatum DSM 3385 TaxID=1121400 RepID=A0A1W2AGY6_9BACT|nr:MauE/DoxX family redox-associated membrane protein [Desulfocicer vacuolatum]SMC59947.1 Methylamine utilisation protein MauE [Desulfocicer vacuolatum DSM 3385]